MQKADGMNYAPVSQGKIVKVCEDGAFCFAAVGLDHGHIFAMCNGLLEAGATLTKVWDADEKKVAEFQETYPGVAIASSVEEILEDDRIKLVASALIPYKRAELGIQVMKSGKDYFADKPGMLSREEISRISQVCAETSRKYMIYFGERVHVESAVFADELIAQGRIGRVCQVTILAPHRLNPSSRPDWFFDSEKNGGIINDLGSHQLEQFLHFCRAKTGRVLHSAVANYANKEHEGFYDFGECVLAADNGATCWFRVDWFTPDGLNAWGDGRVFIMGTEGTIEIRKYLDVTVSTEGDHVILVDGEGEHRYHVTGKTGFPFFGEFILDCLNRTETAMSQDYVFEVMRLAVEAQRGAVVVE
ncbi:MAG: Gfo/Idh/MocA family oxidoreductase [Lachnospiraceae bacterium]|nr:Gfo/Idh/MocA family oxidoreductase [Lachnospiraceae bacterium]